MRSIRPIIMLLFVASSLCGVAEPQSAENWKRIENDAIARKFLNDCKFGKKCPELGNFGWKEIKEYQEKVPELKVARELFKKYNDELITLLMQDEEYKSAREALQATPRTEKIKAGKTFKETQHSIFKRLEKESKAYRAAREKREDSLFESNIKSLEHIIDDYKARGEIFPVEWIPEEAHHHGH